MDNNKLWDVLLSWYKYLSVFLFLDTFICCSFFWLGHTSSFSIGYELDSFHLKPKILTVLEPSGQQWHGLFNWSFCWTELLHINLSRESDFDKNNYHFFGSIIMPGSVVATLCKISLAASYQSYNMGIISPVLQMRKLRPAKSLKLLAREKATSSRSQR